MNSLHINEKNNINLNIKNFKTLIQRNKDVIERVLTQTTLTDFDKKQMSQRENKNKEFENELKLLEKRLEDLLAGLLDNELKQKSILSLENLKKQSDKNEKKIQNKKEQKVLQKVFEQKGFDMNRKYGSGELSEKQWDYELTKYNKACARIPPYILKNLSQMPNNRGYIMVDRYGGGDLWCYGELSEEIGKPLVMFKKIKDDILHIYEIDDNYRTIYEKKGKNNKILISKEKRTKIF